MFSRRTILVLVVVALVFGTWTASALLFSQKATTERHEALAQAEAARQDLRVVTVYQLPETHIMTLISVLRTIVPNAILTVDSSGDRLITSGTPADHEKISDVLKKLASKEISFTTSVGNRQSTARALATPARDAWQPQPPYATYPGTSVTATSGPTDPFSDFAPSNARPDDPEMKELVEADAKMEEEAKSLVGLYRFAGSEEQRDETRAKLEELTNRHFDLRQERRGLELRRLEERLERVRASINAREEARELIIRTRISQLLGEVGDLTF